MERPETPAEELEDTEQEQPHESGLATYLDVIVTEELILINRLAVWFAQTVEEAFVQPRDEHEVRWLVIVQVTCQPCEVLGNSFQIDEFLLRGRTESYGQRMVCACVCVCVCVWRGRGQYGKESGFNIEYVIT